MGRDHQGSVPRRPVEIEPQRSLMHGGSATLKRLHVKRPGAAFPNRGTSGLFEDKFVSRHTRFRDEVLSILSLVSCQRRLSELVLEELMARKEGRVDARIGPRDGLLPGTPGSTNADLRRCHSAAVFARVLSGQIVRGVWDHGQPCREMASEVESCSGYLSTIG
jgi:hypothetical protein